MSLRSSTTTYRSRLPAERPTAGRSSVRLSRVIGPACTFSHEGLARQDRPPRGRDRAADRAIRYKAPRPTPFSNRDSVGCDARRSPVTGSRPSSSLWMGSSARWSATRTLRRVDDWRGGGRRMGVAVPGGFRNAGASLPAVAPFPVAAHRTGQAGFPHPALGRDHAFAHGRPAVRGPRCVSPYSIRSRSSGKRTHCPDRTLCLRQSHWRSRRVACRSIAA